MTRLPVKGAITDLTAQYTREVISDEDYDAMMARLRAQLTSLRALPSEPDRVVERPTGILVKDHWRTLDARGKRRYLLAAQVTVHAHRDERGRLDSWITRDPYKVIGALGEPV